jgi:hypothetical protein
MVSTVPADLANNASLDAIYTAVDVFLIAPGVALPRKARAIRAKTAGSVTLTTFAGSVVTIDIWAGETRYIGFSAVSAATATGLEGLA